MRIPERRNFRRAIFKEQKSALRPPHKAEDSAHGKKCEGRRERSRGNPRNVNQIAAAFGRDERNRNKRPKASARAARKRFKRFRAATFAASARKEAGRERRSPSRFRRRRYFISRKASDSRRIPDAPRGGAAGRKPARKTPNAPFRFRCLHRREIPYRPFGTPGAADIYARRLFTQGRSPYP